MEVIVGDDQIGIIKWWNPFTFRLAPPAPAPSLIHLNSALMREASWNCFKHLGQSRKYPHEHRCWPLTSGAGGRWTAGKAWSTLEVCPKCLFRNTLLFVPNLLLCSWPVTTRPCVRERAEMRLSGRQKGSKPCASVNEEVLADRWKGGWTWVPGTSSNYRCFSCMYWRRQTLVLCT